MSKEDITLDVLMTTYNGEKYVKEQIDSVLNQTYSRFNLIIADDGSTDSTVDILLKYAEIDNRIKIIRNKKNIGVIKNFEQLISISKSKYFMLCDQDDVWLENKIELSINTILGDNVLLAFTDLKLVNQKLDIIDHSYMGYQDIKVQPYLSWKNLVIQNIVTGCTLIADNRLKDYSLPFPDDIPMHDSWLALVASLHGRIRYIDESTVLYRQHNNNVVGGMNSYDRQQSIKDGYTSFIQQREMVLKRSIKMLLAYRSGLSTNVVINDSFDYLLKKYNEYLNVKWLSWGIKGIRFKKKFPSIGFIRNVWWVIYLDYPIIAYIFLVFKKILLFVNYRHYKSRVRNFFS